MLALGPGADDIGTNSFEYGRRYRQYHGIVVFSSSDGQLCLAKADIIQADAMDLNGTQAQKVSQMHHGIGAHGGGRRQA